MSGRRATSLRVATCVAFSCAVVATAQQPEFVDGDPAVLTTTLQSVAPCGQSGSFVATLKVSNRGAHAADPLTFEATPKGGGPAERWRRCPGPYVARFGRGTAPGASTTYEILVRGEPERHKGAIAKAPKASVSEPRQEKKKHEAGSTVDFATATLRNDGERAIDVTLKVRYDRPEACESLSVRRLAPGETTIVAWTEVEADVVSEAHHKSEDELSIDLVAPRGARLSSLKIVDWVEVAKAPDDASLDAFEAAWAAWLRWGDAPNVEGSFDCAFEPSGGDGRSSGTFALSNDGKLVETFAAAPAQEAAEAARRALKAAFFGFSRPDAKVAIEAAKPRLSRKGPTLQFALDGEPWDADLKRMTLRVRDGRFVGHGFDTDLESLRSEWITDAHEGGYLVVGKRTFETSTSSEPSSIESWRHASIDGRLVPVRYVVSRSFPTTSKTTLTLRNVRATREASASLKPVDSEAARKLAAAWDKGYRYPKEGVSFTAKFVATCGKDALWRGRKSVKGRVAIEGFRGDGWTSCRFEIEGESDEAARGTLAWTLEDRLRMWGFRDFGRRPSFDDAFAGATIVETGSEPSSFDVSRGSIRRVVVDAGRVVAVAYADGRERKLAWKSVGGRDVAVAFETGAESLSGDFAVLGDALVPSRMAFKGVFGDAKTWGAEELKLLDIKLK
jgi:hypothetical protein